GGQVFDQVFAAVDQCGSGPDVGIVTLTNAGTYSLTVYGILDFTTPYAFQIVPVVPQQFALNLGQTVTNGVPAAGAGNIESPGATDTYTFTATAGQTVYFDEMTGFGCNPFLRWRLVNPQGGQVFDQVFAAFDQCGSGPDVGIVTLTNAGTYSLTVYGVLDFTTPYAFQIVPVVPQQFALNLGQTVTNGFPAVGAGNIESPGATDSYTFTATAGQMVYFDEQTGLGCNPQLRWRVVNPQGVQVFDQIFAAVDQCNSGSDVGLVTLTNAGSYTVTVYGVLDFTTPYAFRIVPVVPQQFALNLGQAVTNGSPTAGAGNIESPGATDTYTFTATAGQSFFFDELTGLGCSSGLRWQLRNPQGIRVFDDLFAAIDQCNSGGDIGKVTLPATGIYTLTVYGVLDTTDTYSFVVWPLQAPLVPTIANRVLNEGSSLDLTVIASASSPQGYPLRFELVTGPSGATVHPTSGKVRWLVPIGVFGDNAFTIRVRDALGQSTLASFSVGVVAAGDLTFSKFSAPLTGSSGASFNVVSEEKNVGSTTLAGKWEQRVWLSTDAVLDPDDTLLGLFPSNGPLSPGQLISRNTRFTWPTAPGTYYLFARVDATEAVQESNEENNLQRLGPITIGPEYNAVVSSDLEIGLSGTVLPLRGSATKPDGSPAVNVPVTLHIQVRATTRRLSVTTDSAGQFVTLFRPLLGEAGNYTVGAGHPGLADVPAQDQFKLLGISLNPRETTIALPANGSQTFDLKLKNRSQETLQGLKAELLGLPEDAPLTVTVRPPSSLAGDQEITVPLEVRSTSPVGYAARTTLRIRTAEGAIAETTLLIEVSPLASKLVAVPSPLNGSMLRGQQRVIEFDVRNTGANASGPVQILLPSVGWMSVANRLPLASIPAGGSAAVGLLLQPDASLPLGDHQGTLILTDGTTSTTLPYRFTATSDLLGSLTVEVVDELTYYADGSPKVSGANVILRQQGSLTVVTNQVTDAQGRAQFQGLREGYYDVEVTASKHSTYRGTTLLVAGQENSIQPFLTYETVRYEFTVRPTTIEDRTRITLETIFETVVPLPVITLEPNLIDLQDIQSDRTEIELLITNHGLVAAQDMKLNFTSNSRWKFTPLQTQLGALEARSSVSVPLVIERLSAPAPLPSLADGSSGGDCGLGGQACWTLVCGKVTNNYCIPLVIPGACVGDGGRYLPPFFGGDSAGSGAFSPPICQCMPVPCDPCANNVAGALLDYGISGLIPVVSPAAGPPLICLKDGAKCYQDVATCSTNGTCSTQSVLIDCISAGISCGAVVAVAVGASELAVPLGVAGLIAGLAGLGDGIANACKPTAGVAPAGASLAGTDPTFFPGQAAVAVETARLRAILNAYGALFGDPAWIHPQLGTNFIAFANQLAAASRADSPDGQRLTPAERAALLSGSRPELLQQSTIEQFLDRWNRTVDYNRRGIATLAALPAGENPDFLAADVLAAKFALAAQAIDELQAAGHGADLTGGFRVAIQNLIQNLEEGSGGVCARVRLRLTQDAVTTREAFQASLELENNSPEPLTGLKVELQVLAQTGEVATSLFGILTPELTGLNAVDGSGIVPSQTIGSARWLLVPGHNAVPSPNPVVYYIGGYFSYLQEGRTVRVPLSPAPITVHPTPRLELTYFHERDVLSDDPFTDAIEPAIPYSLAVMAKNVGFGPAQGVKIISGRPEIIENEKGLLIDFDLIASEVAGEPVSPSLTVEFGEIAPQQIKSGRWLFTSSLQGQFIGYSATFENIGPLKGLPELSTIEAVSIHELTHIVRAEGPTVLDDGNPDYLVNDVQDDEFLPDRLYLSNGTTNSVSVIRTAVADGAPTAGDLQVEVTVNATQTGWNYLRFLDPSQGQYRLVRVQRASGADLRLGENAWTRDRTFIAGGRRPRYEHSVHLFDHVTLAGSLRYTLTYASLADTDTTAPTSGMIRLPETSRSQIPLQWFGGDNPGGSGIAFYDVFVAVDRGPYEAWLRRTPLTGALFPGTNGHHYAFYTVATDLSNNVEAAPGTADTFTTVGLGNSRPLLAAIPDQVLNEGSLLSLQVQAQDSDLPLDRLTFSVDENAPAGLVIDSESGQLRWLTGEGNGPSTALVSVRVHDSGSPVLSDVRTFRITIREVNSPPNLEPLSDVVLNEGDLLDLTPAASDPDLPAQSLRFALAAGAPTTMSIDPFTGALRWQTTELDGPRTNRIVIQVSDGAVAVERSFAVAVRDTQGDFSLKLGEVFLRTGEAGGIALRVKSGIDLSELAFYLELPPGVLTDLNLVPLSSALGNLSLQPLDATHYEVRIAAAAGQVLSGDADIARLDFKALAGPSSASIALRPVNLQGVRSNGEPLLSPSVENGLIVIIGSQPVLSVDGIVGKLRIHGRIGDTVRIEANRGLESGEPWTLFRQLVLSAPLTELDIPVQPPGAEPLFLRAIKP
ncbi:MAG: hypothetical protein JNN07_25000, partial [Verrucomicrobiales bacterium]|nr:hypothetical protein [Verrucomicrobiales bacterium]